MSATAPALFPVASGLKAPCRMIVVGVGDGGCNSVARMAAAWRNGPDTAYINTDLKALAACTGGRTLAIGKSTTQGYSTAGDPTTGRLAADESPEEIQELLVNHDFALLVGGLGGGTATGALPVIARAARKAGLGTLCLVTTPFAHEGERRRLAAEEGLRALQQDADSVICLPNERIGEITDTALPIEEAFRRPDELLAAGIHSLWRLLTQNGVLNLNFADLRELFARSGGPCAYAHAEATGPARVSAALQHLLESPLLASGRKITEAEGLLICVAGGTDLTLADIEGTLGRLHAMARPNAKVFIGAYVDPALRDRITITLLVTENWLQDRDGKVPARETLHDLTLETVAPGPADTAPGTAAPEQTEIPFEAASRGRFEKIEPTYYRGQDLDIPTYIRRGLKLSFET